MIHRHSEYLDPVGKPPVLLLPLKSPRIFLCQVTWPLTKGTHFPSWLASVDHLWGCLSQASPCILMTPLRLGMCFWVLLLLPYTSSAWENQHSLVCMSRCSETEQVRKICVSRKIKRGAVKGALKKQPPLALYSLSPADMRAGSFIKRSNSDWDTTFKVQSLQESFIQKLSGIPWF